MREPFSVHTPADRPYGVLLALATASSGVRKVSTDSTGPKISSRAIRIDLRDVGENRWREEETAIRDRARRRPAQRALVLPGVGQRA